MAEKVQTISEIRSHLKEALSKLFPQPEASSMAALIISEYTGMSPARQLAFGDTEPGREQVQMIMDAGRRAAKVEPLQYIFGYTLFGGHRIKVARGVLIPRPETEEMVNLIISENGAFSGVATDLCTGSGCIALTLALSFPAAEVWATDNSAVALEIASVNFRESGAGVRIIRSDLLNDRPGTIPLSDLIVSNPPYVRMSEKDSMHSNVTHFEPHEALFVPDDDPMVFYRAILRVAETRLSEIGVIYLEIGRSAAPGSRRLSRRIKSMANTSRIPTRFGTYAEVDPG